MATLMLVKVAVHARHLRLVSCLLLGIQLQLHGHDSITAVTSHHNMKNPWLLSLAPLLLVLAVSSSLPLTAAVSQRRLSFPAARLSPVVECVGDGVYAANSTYEANLRRVAALLLSEVSATPGHSYSYRTRAVGYWPNRLMASSFCWSRRRRDVNDTGGFGYPCADCIAGAFLEVERACPYRREGFFSNRNCTLELAEISIFGTGGMFGEFCYASSKKNSCRF
jgi:hypothetical protein